MLPNDLKLSDGGQEARRLEIRMRDRRSLQHLVRFSNYQHILPVA